MRREGGGLRGGSPPPPPSRPARRKIQAKLYSTEPHKPFSPLPWAPLVYADLAKAQSLLAGKELAWVIWATSYPVVLNWVGMGCNTKLFHANRAQRQKNALHVNLQLDFTPIDLFTSCAQTT